MAELKLPQSWQDWHITEELGEGAYGRVYRAEKKNGGVTAVSAIKVIRVPSERAELLSLRREFASEEELRRNLKAMVDGYANEIRAMYRLQGHTHIVSIQDHVVEELNDGAGWRIYIRMEYLQPFDDYAMTHTFSGKEIIRLGISLCEALSVCAEHGILHRDIKPENLFVTENGQFKLGDFGIAKALDRTVSAYSSKGTFSYMAPEVFHGKPYDSRADLYSTGIILYKLANRNRDPFIDPEKQIITHQDREQAMSRRMQGEKLPSPVDADEKLAKVILKACEFNPKDRYDSPDAMMQALKEITQKAKTTDEKPRKKWILPACMAVILLIAGIAILFSRTVGKPSDSGTANADGLVRLGLAYCEGDGVEQDYNKAEELFREAAAMGNTAAENDLGWMYANGYSVEQNYDEAVKWYTLAAEQGYALAQRNLGYMYWNGYGVEQSYEEAFRWFMMAADQNDLDAQNNVGLFYENGYGVEQNYDEAVKWYTLAAEQGYMIAQNNLGYMYQNGYGVEKDYNEAFKWFSLAADQKHMDAQNNIGWFYANGYGVEQNYDEAVKWYTRAAEQGYALAQRNLGYMYANGHGVEQSYEEAFRWFMTAAEQNDLDAQHSVGLFYANGYGVEQNYDEAVKWYARAAEQGYALSQYNLGDMYCNGNGVELNYGEAFRWFMAAADQNYTPAQTAVGWLYTKGYGVEQNYDEAVKWYTLAAEQGYALAQYNLAWAYVNGSGVEQNAAEAVKWFTRAAENGDALSYYQLGLLYMNGDGVQQDFAKAAEYLEIAASCGIEDAQEKRNECLKHNQSE